MKRLAFALIGGFLLVTSCGVTPTLPETDFAAPTPQPVPMTTTAPDPEATLNQQSVISAFFKYVGKQATKTAIKQAFEQTVKTNLKKYEFNAPGGVRRNGDAEFRRILNEADQAVSALEDPWWVTGIGFIPVVGDAFDIAKMASDAPKLAATVKRIEALVRQAETRLTAINALKGQWRNVNYASLESSLGYHADKHGGGDILRYMRQTDAFAQNLRGATKVNITLQNGESGLKYIKNGKYLIVDLNKRYVSFGNQ